MCFKASLSATETLVLVQKAYGNEALNRSNVFRWYSRFRDWRKLADDKRGGCPKSTQTEVNIAVVAADLVKNDCWITSRMIAESMNIPKAVVLQILKEDFCSQDFFLLHDNVPAHKAARFCQFLTPKNITTLYNPPYPPDLSLSGYFLFLQVENEVKRTIFCRGCWDPRCCNQWIK
jgi:hypothetical protein